MGIFTPAVMLLPKQGTEETWSVIACDQFTAQEEYWDRVEATVGDAPSSLRLILPEAYLSRRSPEAEAEKARQAAAQYLAQGALCETPRCFVYVERTVAGGLTRHGLVGCLDLEAYDWHPDAVTPVRASEKTVPERLPPRIRVRSRALLDLPHVMVLMEDRDGAVFGTLEAVKEALPTLYDFELMAEGGHIRGYAVTGELSEKISAAMEKPAGETSLVIGDGNHSLAAAKACWEEIRNTLSPRERETHPARFALMEVNDVFDEGVCFEPIHRAVLHTDAEALFSHLAARFPGDGGLELISGTKKLPLCVPAASLGGVIGTLQAALEEWCADRGGSVDYIHDDAAARELANAPDAVSILLPAFDKTQLFATVAADGVFPKKSFSIGHARDKRYYLECRKLQEV